MRCLLALGLAAAAACKFTPPTAATDDALPDTPPPLPEVRFVSVTADVAALRPGLYGIEVTAVLRNELDVEVTGVRATLTFHEGIADRAADFRWRDADARDGVMEPQPEAIAPGAEVTLRFRVDALASAAPLAAGASILVGGAAVVEHGGAQRSAAPPEPPASLPFEALPAPIVVTTPDDRVDGGDGVTSFREALSQANASPGFDRIVFDPTVFPPSSQTVTVLRQQLGPLPAIAGDLVIDAGQTPFVLAADSNWEGRREYGLRLQGGTLVVHAVAFRDMGHNYPPEDVSSNNCGSNQQHEGGAIRVDGGTLILDGGLFADTGVNERNCYAASVRIHGGSGHRILNSRWTDQSMDSIFVAAATREISGNVMDAGGNLAKADECIFIQAQGGADLWIVGNLCIDQEYSAIVANSGDPGRLYIVHNTFARNRDLGAVRRTGSGTRRIELRNNVYLDNAPAAISTTNNGSDFTISHEAKAGSGGFCSNCTAAMVMSMTLAIDVALQLTNPGGTTPAHFTPRTGSPLVDTGMDLVDRNGPTPRRYNGAGPDRGAFELP